MGSNLDPGEIFYSFNDYNSTYHVLNIGYDITMMVEKNNLFSIQRQTLILGLECKYIKNVRLINF